MTGFHFVNKRYASLTEFSAFYKTPPRRLFLTGLYCRLMHQNENRFKRVLIAAMKKTEKWFLSSLFERHDIKNLIIILSVLKCLIFALNSKINVDESSVELRRIAAAPPLIKYTKYKHLRTFRHKWIPSALQYSRSDKGQGAADIVCFKLLVSLIFILSLDLT